MQEKISKLEKAALAEKPWQLTGEVSAQTRPENSMLEEDLDFDQASRMGMATHHSNIFNIAHVEFSLVIIKHVLTQGLFIYFINFSFFFFLLTS